MSIQSFNYAQLFKFYFSKNPLKMAQFSTCPLVLRKQIKLSEIFFKKSTTMKFSKNRFYLTKFTLFSLN